MKKFFSAAFSITPFQIIAILVLSCAKYLLNIFHVVDNLIIPITWICLGGALLFMTAVGIAGYVENNGKVFEEWRKKQRKTIWKKLLAGVASAGFAMPASLGAVLLIYLFTPTSIEMLVALFAGIVIGNIVSYSLEKL